MSGVAPEPVQPIAAAAAKPADTAKPVDSKTPAVTATAASDGKTTPPAATAAVVAPKWSAQFEKLIGKEFINNKGEKFGEEKLKGKVFGIYFSAHWCPPCRGFTPELVKTYNKLQKAGKQFELVFASSDKDQNAFDQYFHEMPWLAVPFADRTRKTNLSTQYGVQGIPTLVIIDGNTGAIITKNGRAAIMADRDGKNFPWESKPASELTQMTVSDINDVAMLIVFLNTREEWTCNACTMRNSGSNACSTCSTPRSMSAEAEATTVRTVVDEATGNSVVKALSTVATEAKAAAQKDGKDLSVQFLYGKNDPVVPKILSFMQLAPDTMMALIDIPNRCKYVSPKKLSELNEQTIREFYCGYRDNKLTKIDLEMPRDE